LAGYTKFGSALAAVVAIGAAAALVISIKHHAAAIVPAGSAVTSQSTAALEADDVTFNSAKLDISVRDPLAAAAWYHDHLGFDIDTHGATARLHRDKCEITLQKG